MIQHSFRYLEDGVLPAEGAGCQQTTPFEAAGGGASGRPARPAAWDTGARLR